LHCATITLTAQQLARMLITRSLILSLSHSTTSTSRPPADNLRFQLNLHINNMPKEKVTRGKGKATKADSGKKKKGKSIACIASKSRF
jgi:hypothetical protein